MTAIAWVEIFVEEPSMEYALQALIPKIRPDLTGCFAIHAFAGVNDMLNKLPDRLKGYIGWLPSDWRILVVRDEDRKKCSQLKAEIETIVRKAGLAPKTKKGATFNVLTRIAVEELEAWLLGDVEALAATYPGIPQTLASQRAFRDVDAVRGGTWEALERVLQKAGHFLGGLPKIQVAREVAANMEPDRNTSRSFKAFKDGLQAL